MIKLIFATNNQAKINEVKNLGHDLGIEVLSLSDAGIHMECDEDADTFEENAKQKLASVTDQVSDISAWITAEDSGMTIDYLNGAPGVRTRRWAGHEMSDQELIDYTLQQLEGVPYQQRGASFHSAVALMHSSNPEAKHVFSGEIRGKILIKPDTSKTMEGFPFRQLFYISEVSRMLGDSDDLPPEQAKYFHTHRQKAFVKAFNYVKDISSIN